MTAQLDLYWIPLGAGQNVVRISGKVYEGLCAFVHRREPCDLYHSALVATTGDAQYTIEMTPVPRANDGDDRGVVTGGCVGSRLLRRFRIYRYEIRCWRNGQIPDLRYAVGSPVHITDDPAAVQRVVDLAPCVPPLVWGRDEIHAGEMWNSNSVVSWLLTQAGLCSAAGSPPGHGRAPGWTAGVAAARAAV